MAKNKAETEHIYTDLYEVIHGNMATKSGDRVVYPVDITSESEDLNAIVEKLGISKAEAIREAIKYYAEYLRGLEVITYRKVSKEQAKKEIEKYIKGKKRVWADEISDYLQLELGFVNEVLLELWKEGWVEPR